MYKTAPSLNTGNIEEDGESEHTVPDSSSDENCVGSHKRKRPAPSSSSRPTRRRVFLRRNTSLSTAAEVIDLSGEVNSIHRKPSIPVPSMRLRDPQTNTGALSFSTLDSVHTDIIDVSSTLPIQTLQAQILLSSHNCPNSSEARVILISNISHHHLSSVSSRQLHNFQDTSR